MRAFVNGQAAKSIVALIGIVTTYLAHYSNTWWAPTVSSLLTFLGVYLVPNAKPDAPPVPAPKEPAGM